MRVSSAKIAVFFLILSICSCSSVKRLHDGELLLTKNTVKIDGDVNNTDEINGLLAQQPNTTLLGIPIRLHIYNLARENADSIFDHKLKSHLDSMTAFDKFISKKQLAKVADYKISFNHWLKKTGEAPVVYDEKKAKKSAAKLSLFYESKGYFNNEVHFATDTANVEHKKVEVNYNVTKNKPYYLDSITSNIASKEVDSIYNLHKNETLLHEGDQFNFYSFEAERDRLSSLFLNNGIYKFQPSSIFFDVKIDTIPAHNDTRVPVAIRVDNYGVRTTDSIKETPYRVHTVKDVNIYSDYNTTYTNDSLKQVHYKGYTIYYHDKLRFKPKALTDAVAIAPNEVYSDQNRSLTYKQISNLQTFKYPGIEYNYADSTKAKLSSNIYLSPRPKFSLGFNTDVTHSNIQDFGISFSTSVISRNIFRGAETLELALRGSVGSSKDTRIPNNNFFNLSEFGGDIRLNFPRIWFPINTDKYIPKSMTPQTRLSLGTTFQKNIGLDKQSLSTILRYSWNPNNKVKNSFDLMNVQFVRNTNIDRFFSVYQNTYSQLNDISDAYKGNTNYYDENGNLTIPQGTTAYIADALAGNINGLSPGTNDYNVVRRIEERRKRLTANNLIFASSFTHTINTRQGFDDHSFYQFRAKLELAGNTLSAFSKVIDFNKSDDGKNQVFGVPYSQYVKTELDYIKYFEIFGGDVLAFRSFFGFAIPYGNSDNIPFIRSYFAGGSNDNRAWQAYALGPGRTNNVNDFNEANLKIALNLEYRFKIFGSLNGALFADAGNIWNALDNTDNKEAVFENLSSLQELALGTGVGLRYDFGFFVIRFDTGFKTYNPSREAGNRWFTDYNFRSVVYNIGINYPF
uniref:translocation and assembly module lipoprotein TamL n=1 Tax=Zhouia sp. PK063 TaxID=3373602 RepID=UPI0037DD9E28